MKNIGNKLCSKVYILRYFYKMKRCSGS